MECALADKYPETVAEIRVNMATRGVADAYIHPLLPDLSRVDKQIVIGAGIKRFFDITGKNPRFIWLPESAVDTETLEVLIKNGIEGFICAPNQVVLNDGSDPNNVPTRIKPPSGETILALTYDQALSHKLAFEDDKDHPLRDDAYKFRDLVIRPALDRLRNGFPLMGYTDGETFGHHMQWGGDFIDTLINRALPEAGIMPISINEIGFNKVTIAEGRIWDRSAWSCLHGDLARWHGKCDCCGGAEVGWKEPFNKAFNFLNDRITKIIEGELGSSYIEKMIANFDQAFKNPGPPATTPELSLISSKVSALTALTSCATFFGDPHVSGRINILHARVAVEHLKDAGLPNRARALWSTFLSSMEQVWDPTNPGKTGRDMTEKLLRDRSYC